MPEHSGAESVPLPQPPQHSAAQHSAAQHSSACGRGLSVLTQPSSAYGLRRSKRSPSSYFLMPKGSSGTTMPAAHHAARAAHAAAATPHQPAMACAHHHDHDHDHDGQPMQQQPNQPAMACHHSAQRTTHSAEPSAGCACAVRGVCACKRGRQARRAACKGHAAWPLHCSQHCTARHGLAVTVALAPSPAHRCWRRPPSQRCTAAAANK